MGEVGPEIDLIASGNVVSRPGEPLLARIPGPPPPVADMGPDPTPQLALNTFWKKFSSTAPAKAFTLLPNYQPSARTVIPKKDQKEGPRPVKFSYQQAREECVRKVDKIVKECRSLNQKYRDPYFEMERYFSSNGQTCNDCLMELGDNKLNLDPGSVKRVGDIFTDPQFYIEGATAGDVRQGNDGDCWFLSALCTVSNVKNLIYEICVHKDEKVGVYGFVFNRDGEWFSEIVDDKLYLTKPDFFDLPPEEQRSWNEQYRKDAEEEYRKAFQVGSQALYFAQCNDLNETWLPLLEKAYAKAHGDYSAIDGGWSGEAVEDLTGGVTTELFGTDIIDTDRFWTDELRKVHKDFLFSCGLANNWDYDTKKGLVFGHAYSIMDAVEHVRDGKNYRLVKVRNPWGDSEWQGAWADGSEQWDGYWMETLNHKFGDDGTFWMAYEDLLKYFHDFDRTRMFDDRWMVSQQWSSISVPWTLEYLDTKFKLEVTESGRSVIVLSQLDERYFHGLEGQYRFTLQFRLHKGDEEDYIIRSQSNYSMKRSVCAEVDLEPGVYHIVMRIEATRDESRLPPEKVIPMKCVDRRNKLLAVGLSYDLAHARGQFKESAKEANMREKKETRENQKKAIKANYEQNKKQRMKNKLRQLRLDAKTAARNAKMNPQGGATQEPPAGGGPSGRREASQIMTPPADGASIAPTPSDANAPSGQLGPQVAKFLAETDYDHPGGASQAAAALLSKTGYEPAATPEVGGTSKEKADVGASAKTSEIPELSSLVSNEDKPVDSVVASTSNVASAPQAPPSPPSAQLAPPSQGDQGPVVPDKSTSNGPATNPPDAPDPLSVAAPPIPAISTPQDLLQPPTIPPRLTLADISDDDISWDSEIDYPTSPSSTASDSSFDSVSSSALNLLEPSSTWKEKNTPLPNPANPLPLDGGPPIGGAMPPPKDPGVDIGQLLEDPWNAVCVVGLRVYQLGAKGVQIEVVKPGNGRGERGVDVDDGAADAIRRMRVEGEK
ncbi:MAG: hypothetical protein M1820_004508 [Bogoriella megaspora]|nr:MAG: hypothetical protein M1820_004508 [Bogoriella megaspora]